MTAMEGRRASAMVILLALFSVCATAPCVAAVRAITRPNADRTLSFVQPGRIAEVYFKEGDMVESDQVLMRQDDAVEQVRLAQLKAQSEDRTRIRAGEASLAQKKLDLEKLEKAAARDAATQLEVEHARLDVTIAELSLAMATFEHEQANLKYQEQQARVDNMRLRSPIDGRIERIDVEVGESVNALTEVVQVVQTNPLWIDAPVPIAEARGLKRGMPAKVGFLEENRSYSAHGQIVFVGAVVDAASGTLRVRVEVPNETNRPAGEHVVVSF
jgi:membrane fusion protein (multidrug efflux system)